MEYGLIGEHLPHSFSPEIHRRIGDYKYEIKELAPKELADFIKNRDFKAINVTIPYKQAVIPLLDEIDDAAKAFRRGLLWCLPRRWPLRRHQFRQAGE